MVTSGDVEGIRKVVRGSSARRTSWNTKQNGDTPLSHAVRFGFETIVELLLEAGAKVNERNEAGFAPIHIAAQNGHCELVKKLLAVGASVSEADEEKTLPPTMQMLQGRPYRPKKTPQRKTKSLPLHLAAENGHVATVALLMDLSRNLYKKDGADLTALELAAMNGHADVVEQLLCKPAPVSENDDESLNSSFSDLQVMPVPPSPSSTGTIVVCLSPVLYNAPYVPPRRRHNSAVEKVSTCAGLVALGPISHFYL
ncbi:hypothetical protein CYMTET_36649 [Cymbomonas tetramitiformis]|uniref:Uncharacterized protein n=1 Tax=Cymbomonas tetramitiformis TaxID=36881 RepID=A0AAE0CH30_9CHLO|nr:hypothetical protein CYMTET_36649 [Cymbomonas tetramitiformis]